MKQLKRYQAGGTTKSYEDWRNSLPKRLQNTSDYDLKGYYDKYGAVNITGDQHLTDEFKLPNHVTFSNESIYSNPQTPGGQWSQVNNKWVFTPSQHNIANVGLDSLKTYFKENEPESILNIPKQLAPLSSPVMQRSSIPVPTKYQFGGTQLQDIGYEQPNPSNTSVYRPSPYKPQPNRLKIKDDRKVSATTNQPVNPNKDLVSGNYDTNKVDMLIHYAKIYGIDPYKLISMDLQETGLGNSKKDLVAHNNTLIPPGHVLMGDNDINTPSKVKEKAFTDLNIDHSIDYNQYNNILGYDNFARVYQDKVNYAKSLGLNSEEQQLQAFNGFGKVFPSTEQDYNGFKMKKIYGVDVPSTGIDMKQNPLYGKRVLDYSNNVLKNSPDIVNAVDSVYQVGGAYSSNEDLGELYSKGFSKEQNADALKQKAWLQNWYANRKNIESPSGGNIPVNPTKLSRMPDVLASKDLPPHTLGINGSDGNIAINPNYPLSSDTYLHELDHQYQTQLLNNNKGYLFTKGINTATSQSSSAKKFQSGNTDFQYWVDPKEVHSRIMQLRYDQKFKPDQTINLNDIKNIDLNKYNLNMYSPDQIKNILNQTVANFPNLDNVNNIAKTGGNITNTGYKDNSPDKNNDFNIIPNNSITMKGVKFPVLGTDNYGNQQMMHPGMEYIFPGDYVHELPIKKDGGIHIKKSHEGKFTEYKKRTGKTTEEAKHSSDPRVRKMANFAANAAKWKKQTGGDYIDPGKTSMNGVNLDHPFNQQLDMTKLAIPGQRQNFNLFNNDLGYGFDQVAKVGEDINQGIHDRYNNNYLRDRMTSDSLFAPVQGGTSGMRGDYDVTGSSYGQFRPDQLGAKSPYGMQGKYYQSGGGYIPEDVDNTNKFQGSGLGPNALSNIPDNIPSSPAIGPSNIPISSPDISNQKEVDVNDSTKFAYNYYTKEKGLPSHIAAGIVGNLYQESGLKPGAVEQDHTGNGRGIAQWDVRDRWNGYLAWAKQNERNPYDLKSQLDYVLGEPGQSKQALDKLKNTTTPEQAALIFGKIYERPSEKYANWNVREKVASQLNNGYQEGGTYDLTESEINHILQNGGELTYES